MKKRKKINLIPGLAAICLISCFCVSNMYARYVSRDDTHAFSFDVFANYNVTFDANGGGIDISSLDDTYSSKTAASAVRIMEVGEAYGELPVPTREGYSFTGWNAVPDTIPDDYVIVDGLTALQQNPGEHQYINTGFTPSENTKIECSFKINDGRTDANQFYLGEWFSIYGSGTQFSLTMNYVQQKYSYQYGTYNDINHAVDLERHTFIQDGKDFYQDGELIYTSKNTLSTASSNMLLFDRGSTGTYAKATIYYFRIWDKGVLVRDFVPVMTVRGNKCGMFDLVTKQFYGNSGGGSFSCGGIVANAKISSDDVVSYAGDYTLYAVWSPSFTVTLDANGGNCADDSINVTYGLPYGNLPVPTREGYEFDGWWRMPEKYQTANGLKATQPAGNKQWLDTGYTPSAKTKIECAFKVSDAGKNKDAEHFLSGEWFSIYGSGTEFSLTLNYQQQKYSYQYGSYDDINHAVDCEEHVFIQDGYSFYQDGELIYTSNKSLTTAKNDLVLFNRVVDNTYAKAVIYYFKIWDAEILVRDFIPVWGESENAYGMYDLVNGEFYGNSGNGAFETDSDSPEHISLHQITDETNVEINCDHTLYAHWKEAPQH